MTDEKTLGAHEADISTIKDQNKKIFDKLDKIGSTLDKHIASGDVHLDSIAIHLSVINGRVGKTEERVEDLENTHHRIKWMFFGAGGAGLFGGATMWETIRTMLGKGP